MFFNLVVNNIFFFFFKKIQFRVKDVTFIVKRGTFFRDGFVCFAGNFFFRTDNTSL